MRPLEVQLEPLPAGANLDVAPLDALLVAVGHLFQLAERRLAVAGRDRLMQGHVSDAGRIRGYGAARIAAFRGLLDSD